MQKKTLPNLIIDPLAAFITAYNMFSPADYFCEDASKLNDTGEEGHLKRHMENVSRCSLLQRYNTTITELDSLKKEYDKIIIVFQLNHINDPATNHWDSISDNPPDDRKSFQNYFKKIASKLEKIKYNHLIFLDHHDRAVCSIGEKWFQENFLPYDGIFKREFRKTHLYDYSNKVFSFPFLMFGSTPTNSCALLFENRKKGSKNINECIWPGFGYDNLALGQRDTWCCRQTLLRKVASSIHIVCESNHDNFLNLFNTYKMFLHLNGNGHICKRMFEGLSRDSLMIMEEMDVLFPFENDDFFAKECIFTFPKELTEKLNNLKNNESLYNICKQQQEYIVDKYYNYNWIRNYVNSKLT